MDLAAEEVSDGGELLGRYGRACPPRTLDVRLGRRGLFHLLVEYENQDWEGAQNANIRDFQRIALRPSLQWRYRRLELIMEAQFFVMDQPTVGVDQTFDRFFVRLRRYF